MKAKVDVQGNIIKLQLMSNFVFNSLIQPIFLNSLENAAYSIKRGKTKLSQCHDFSHLYVHVLP